MRGNTGTAVVPRPSCADLLRFFTRSLSKALTDSLIGARLCINDHVGAGRGHCPRLCSIVGSYGIVVDGVRSARSRVTGGVLKAT